MSIKSTSPLRVAGAVLDTTDVGTGEQSWTQGGQETFCSLSGLGAAALVASGPGRLNKILVLNNIVSGQPYAFVDSAVATSGMPFSTSGHKTIAVIPPVWHPSASGVTLAASTPGGVQLPEAVFFSGLCACPLASGAGSFTVLFTFGLNPTLSGTSPPN